MAKMSRDSSNPLYLQIASYIRERIYAQEWGAIERIPSEHELVRLFGVSRGTVKRGIEVLVDEGLLVQRRGKGTFVTRPVVYRPAGRSLLSMAESLRLEGVNYETRVIEMRRVTADSVCAQRLGVKKGAEVLKLHRVRSAGGSPLALMESLLNMSACPGVDRFDYTRRSLFSSVEETSHRRIGYARARYGACVAGKRCGDLLGCEHASPVLHVDQVVYLEDGTPVEWGSMWYPPNRYLKASLFRGSGHEADEPREGRTTMVI